MFNAAMVHVWLLRDGSKWVLCNKSNTTLHSFTTKKAAMQYASTKRWMLHDGY